MVGGLVEGTVEIAERLTLEPGGRLEAETHAGEVIIGGSTKGNLCSAGRLTLRSSGSIEGDVEAGPILVEAGGVLNGTVRPRRRPA